MTIEDAAAVAGLSGELGYPANCEETADRIRALIHLPDHALYVACEDRRVIGWIDAAIARHLATPPFGEIAGLVVSENNRSSGVGKLLVKAAEEWIAAQGIKKIVVRSRVARERAHRFYLRLGFEEWKRQAVFRKQL